MDYSDWIADSSWTIGFVDRTQLSKAAQLPLTLSLASMADQSSYHTKLISSARRSLLQAAQTYQATVSFTLAFKSQSTSAQTSVTQDVSTAIKQVTAPLNTVTTITPVAASATLTLNVSVLFPAGNTVSVTPSQATLAAVNLTNGLTTNPAQALPSLSAKDGAFQVLNISISDALVAQGSPSSTQRTPPVTASIIPAVVPAQSMSSSLSTPSPTTGASPIPPVAPGLSQAPMQAPVPSPTPALSSSPLTSTPTVTSPTSTPPPLPPPPSPPSPPALPLPASPLNSNVIATGSPTQVRSCHYLLSMPTRQCGICAISASQDASQHSNVPHQDAFP